MKYIITFLLILMVGVNGWSQEVIELKSNKTLQRYEVSLQQELPKAWRYDPVAGLEKSDCNPIQSGINYLSPNELLMKDVGFLVNYFVDSIGVLSCINCDDLNFGTATLTSDTLVYTANSGVVSGFDSLKVSYCSAALDTCYFSVVYNIQVNRSTQHHQIPTVTLMPEETVILAADPGLLTGELVCSEFVNCLDNNYEGRGQRIYFTTYDEADFQFVYEASREGGLDSICLRMCDENGVCDIFHFAVEVTQGMISTPFLDDFSKEGAVTDEEHWLNREVFINRTIAKDPPSIGVATFDGIDLRGNAYGDAYGESDYLTSNRIQFGAGNNYNLSYWIQPGGLGYRPELQDSLVVQFRDQGGNWNQMASHAGVAGDVSINTIQPFEFFTIPVSGAYKYDGFQFRFINFSDKEGMGDVWHLDYVRLDNNPAEAFFDDVAFSKNPIYVLENYRSMPWRHLKGNETEALANSVEVGLFNHTAQALNISPTTIKIDEIITGESILGTDNTILLNGTEANVTNQEPNNRSFMMSAFPSAGSSILGTFQGKMQDPVFDGQDKLTFNVTYKLSNNTQVSGVGYEDVLRNDEVVQSTVFDDYFAYDDGTAEASIFVTQGNQMAVEYATAEPDQLQAVQFFFPHVSRQVEENQKFILKVWTGTLTGTPIYEHTFNAYPADLYFDTLQGFTTYPLVDEDGDLAPLDLPTGTFYVGWEQKDPCQSFYCIGVGYDRNNANAKAFAYIFNPETNEWDPQLESIDAGAIMMRPIVGTEGQSSTAVKDPNIAPRYLVLCPNPVDRQLSVTMPQGSDDNYTYVLYNHLGQQLSSPTVLDAPIDCSDLKEGFYFIEVLGLKQGGRWMEKFVVVH